VESQLRDGGRQFIVQLGEEMRILFDGGLVSSLQSFEFGENLHLEDGSFCVVDLRVCLPGSKSSGLLGLAYY